MYQQGGDLSVKANNVKILYVEHELGVPGQILQSRKLASYLKSTPCLPSTKTKTDLARIKFGIFSVIVQEAFRVEL
jgi:hypothetical protein